MVGFAMIFCSFLDSRYYGLIISLREVLRWYF
jgi:hypothetical protein